MMSKETCKHFARRAALCGLALALTALGLVASGCNYVVLAGYLIGGPPSIEPDFDAMTGKSMTDHNVKVVVVCYAPKKLQLKYPRVHKELEKYVATKLTMHHVKVAPPDLVRAWIDQNPEWDKAEEIGAAFDATYVVYIDLNSYSLYE